MKNYAIQFQREAIEFKIMSISHGEEGGHH